MAGNFSGSLITFEGIDGSGKTSLMQCLSSSLRQLGLPVVITKEPGGSSLGQELREIVNRRKEPICDEAEFLLFAADRAQHFAQCVIPELKNGSVVVSDRMADSSLAYQGYGRGMDKRMISKVNDWVMHHITPDLTVYLRLDPMIVLERVHKRDEPITSFEQEKLDFWRRVSHGYDEIFANRANVITLDASLSQHTLCGLAQREIMRVVSR